MSYFSNTWGELVFPIPAFIQHISVFNFTRSIVIITGEICALFFILFPYNILDARKSVTVSLAAFLCFEHFLGILFEEWCEPIAVCLAAILFFLVIFCDGLIIHLDIALSSYILIYMLSIMYIIQDTIIATIVFFEITLAFYLVIILEEIYIKKKDIESKKILKICQQSKISDLLHRSLHIAYSVTILTCQLSPYNFFKAGHTASSAFSFFHNFVPIMTGLLWPLAVLYNGLFLGISVPVQKWHSCHSTTYNWDFIFWKWGTLIVRLKFILMFNPWSIGSSIKKSFVEAVFHIRYGREKTKRIIF